MNEPAQFLDLITRCRARCLWFVDFDETPREREAQIQLLHWIERYGNRDDFVRARKLRQWLLQHSSEAFAVS